MRTPTIAPSDLRTIALEVINEGHWTPHQLTAERLAVEWALASALTPLVRDKVHQHDLHEYLNALHTVTECDRTRPQADGSWRYREAWEADLDAAEHKVSRIGWRIVDGGRVE